MFWPTLLVSLIGFTSAALICSDFGTYNDRTYYTKVVPETCKGHHGPVRGWRPTYRITEKYTKCPSGWKEYNSHCYWSVKERENRNFMEHEQLCNTYKAHIWFPNTKAEADWVNDNIMRNNEWHWVGIFCSGDLGKTQNVSEMRLVSGEDLSEINKNLNARMEGGHWIHQFDHNCAMNKHNDPNWRTKFHHQGCHEGRRGICEALLG